MHQRVVDVEGKGDEIGAHAEINRLTEAQYAGEPPNEIDTEREDGKA